MSSFLQEKILWEKFELLIDTQIFSKDIILKAAYNFLDKGYFFFKLDSNRNIILEFTKKHDIDIKPEIIVWEFSDELLDVYLRDSLEKENKVIREAIVTKAINWPLDMENFVSLDTDNRESYDIDKDISEILKEIENDPELQIDDWEIENILKEIEEDMNNQTQKPGITINPDSLSDAKSMFKKK